MVIVKEPEVIYKDREIEKVVEKDRIVEVEKVVNRITEVTALEISCVSDESCLRDMCSRKPQTLFKSVTPGGRPCLHSPWLLQ